MCIVIAETKARSRALILVVRLYRVAKPAGLTHNRHRAIAKTHQLAQSARLKERRHQECIARRIDAVGALIGVEYICRDAVRILPRKMAEQMFILLLAGTQHNELCILRTDFLDHIIDQIEAFLVGQARYNTDHKFLIVHLKT